MGLLLDGSVGGDGGQLCSEVEQVNAPSWKGRFTATDPLQPVDVQICRDQVCKKMT